MVFSRRIACLVFLVPILFTFPIALPAQESGEHTSDQSTATARKSTVARPALNEQQRRGEALFVQNCTLCHMPSNQKKRLGIQGPTLEGVYGEDAETDALRQFIQQGLPGKMPGFRYGLEPKDIDDVVAYLKVGAHLKPSGGSN
ncbi:MAG: Cytochrome oxidase, cbb3-type, subunit [Blastocatellia bacterium]|jgi:mono/diheme cytochrome c family protein|nr:Cytochrome oxidase, cbb3-type, subunit [Blastocatellia bacterium]